jgi:hypothetical protein
VETVIATVRAAAEGAGVSVISVVYEKVEVIVPPELVRLDNF